MFCSSIKCKSKKWYLNSIKVNTFKPEKPKGENNFISWKCQICGRCHRFAVIFVNSVISIDLCYWSGSSFFSGSRFFSQFIDTTLIMFVEILINKPWLYSRDFQVKKFLESKKSKFFLKKSRNCCWKIGNFVKKIDNFVKKSKNLSKKTKILSKKL